METKEWVDMSVEEKLDGLRGMLSHTHNESKVRWAATQAWMDDYDQKYDALKKKKSGLVNEKGEYL